VKKGNETEIVPDSTPYFNRIPVPEPKDMMHSNANKSLAKNMTETINATLAKNVTAEVAVPKAIEVKVNDTKPAEKPIEVNATLAKANETNNATLAKPVEKEEPVK
jgi:hypothetical protein